MDMSLEALPDDLGALKALLIAKHQSLLQAEALVAIAQAEVTEAYALIDELKLRIAKARQDKMGAVVRAPEASARPARNAARGCRHLRDRG
jgi:hypothetical protein